METIDLQSKYPKCPKPGTYLRHKQTGDLAQVIERDGDWVIKPDIPGSPVFYPATQAYLYNIEAKPKKMPPGSFARVAYEADKALCNIHTELKKQKEWIDLKANDRAAWIEGRVKLDHPTRLELYISIMKVLEASGD